MPIVLDYLCTDCGTKIENYFKMSRDEPDPECPGCKAIAQKMPPLVSIGTMKGKAVDIAQNEVERMGFTNMKDNLREGDIAAPSLPPPMQSAVKNFWNGGGVPALAGSNIMQVARSSHDGSANPLTKLHRRKKELLDQSR